MRKEICKNLIQQLSLLLLLILGQKDHVDQLLSYLLVTKDGGSQLHLSPHLDELHLHSRSLDRALRVYSGWMAQMPWLATNASSGVGAKGVGDRVQARARARVTGEDGDETTIISSLAVARTFIGLGIEASLGRGMRART